MEPMDKNEIQLKNDNTIRILRLCDEYENLQKELSVLLSNGFLYLNQAKKNTSNAISSIQSIRLNLDSELFLSSKSDEFEIVKKGNNGVYLFSGLPNPSIRRSQKCFADACQKIITLCNLISLIEKELKLETQSNRLSENSTKPEQGPPKEKKEITLSLEEEDNGKERNNKD